MRWTYLQHEIGDIKMRLMRPRDTIESDPPPSEAGEDALRLLGMIEAAGQVLAHARDWCTARAVDANEDAER